MRTYHVKMQWQLCALYAKWKGTRTLFDSYCK